MMNDCDDITLTTVADSQVELIVRPIERGSQLFGEPTSPEGHAAATATEAEENGIAPIPHATTTPMHMPHSFQSPNGNSKLA